MGGAEAIPTAPFIPRLVRVALIELHVRKLLLI